MFFFLMKQDFCSRAALEKHLGHKQLISTLPRVTAGRAQVLQPFQHPSCARQCHPNRHSPRAGGHRANVPAPSELLALHSQARREKKHRFVFHARRCPSRFTFPGILSRSRDRRRGQVLL